ncbi:MAG: hypothetical protein GX555_17070 [Actinomycetales bacterium]|nr:hypothetical protein [Actinomycetales bacterium]
MADEGGSGPLGMLDPVISSWDEAIGAVRTRAKWLLAGIGAVAALLFGTAPLVTRPTLSWSEDTLQLLVAILVAALGLGLLAIVAKQVADVFKPVTSSLAELDEVTREDLEKNREEYLGPRDDGSPAQDQLREANRRVLALERALTGARGTEKVLVEGALREAKAYQSDITAGVEALLEFDRYNKVVRNRSLSDRSFFLAFGAVLAGIVFQLTLTHAPADEEAGDGGAGGPAPTVALLTHPADDAEARAVWEALDLPACTSGEDDTVVVLVTGGSGSVDAPYQVQTIPEAAQSPDCPRLSFTVVSSLITVTPVPEKVTVEWPTDAPEETPTE